MKQGGKEWLDFRKDKIGASDMPCLFGVGFSTPFKIWQVKLGMVEIQKTAPMIRGLEMEPTIRQAYEIEVGFSVEPDVIVHPEIPYLMASLDGHNREKGKAAEFKLAGRVDHEIARKGNIPDKYYPQLQQQLACTTYKNMDYYSFYDNLGRDKPDTVRINVNRNDEYIDKLYEVAAEFYQCMTNLTPPPLTEADYYQRSDEFWLEKGKEWIEACENFDLWKEKKDALRDELIQASEGRSSIGGGVRLRQYFSKGSVNYSKIPELKNVDLDHYRSPQKQSWRLEANGRHTRKSYN